MADEVKCENTVELSNQDLLDRGFTVFAPSYLKGETTKSEKPVAPDTKALEDALEKELVRPLPVGKSSK